MDYPLAYNFFSTVSWGPTSNWQPDVTEHIHCTGDPNLGPADFNPTINIQDLIWPPCLCQVEGLKIVGQGSGDVAGGSTETWKWSVTSTG
jgi:hypothetical protein